MNHVSLRCAVGLSLLLTAFGASAAAEPPTANPAVRKWSLEELDFFEKRIRPVLAERCYSCHSAKAKIVQANLKLDTAAGVRAGGDSGPVVAAGKPADSLLIQAIRWESVEMPPDGKLPDAVVADFARWLEMGAPDPRTGDDQGQHAAIVVGCGAPLGLSAADRPSAAGRQGFGVAEQRPRSLHPGCAPAAWPEPFAARRATHAAAACVL